MLRNILFLFLASTLGLFAQGGFSPIPMLLGIPPELVQYLSLTSAQVSTVNRLLNDNQRLAAEKSRRMAQVQGEIALELNKDPLDPMSIGIRYAEIEAIRRGLDAESERMRVAVRAVLTDPQKVKLKTLEEASKLGSTISLAVCFGFLDPTSYAMPRLGASFTNVLIAMPIPSYSANFGCDIRTVLTFAPGPADQPTQK
jgi:hypothetical protein